MKVDNITVGAMEKSSVLDLNYIIENVCIVIFILGREILQICKRKEKKKQICSSPIQLNSSALFSKFDYRKFRIKVFFMNKIFRHYLLLMFQAKEEKS